MKWFYGDVLIFSISIAVIQYVSMPIIIFGKCNYLQVLVNVMIGL